MDEEKSLGDKIVQFIDDRMQQGIRTSSLDVQNHFALPSQDTFVELEDLLEAGRIEMLSDNSLEVTYA